MKLHERHEIDSNSPEDGGTGLALIIYNEIAVAKANTRLTETSDFQGIAFVPGGTTDRSFPAMKAPTIGTRTKAISNGAGESLLKPITPAHNNKGSHMAEVTVRTINIRRFCLSWPSVNFMIIQIQPVTDIG